MTGPADIHRRLLGSVAVNDVFSDTAMLARLLMFEAELANAQAECGVIPVRAAGVIAEVAAGFTADIPTLAADGARAGTVIIPLVARLTEAVKSRDAEAASWVHFGATSQDVIDTASVLGWREAVGFIDADLEIAQNAAVNLEELHHDTVMLSRTLLQPAPPTTFGFKAGGWAHDLEQARVGLIKAARATHFLQLGGAAGTLAALGSAGPDVARALARRLDLDVPQRPWHTSRQGVVALGASLGVVTGTLGKIARDISLLMQFEVGEVSEPGGPGRGGSSAMPHKRNPSGSMVALAAATRVPGLVAALLSAMVQDHERALGGWQSEGLTLPQIFEATGGAAVAMAGVLEGLEVFPRRMEANLAATQGLVMSERVAIALAEHMGREKAKQLLAAACDAVFQTGKSLTEVLIADPAVTDVISVETLKDLTRPETYLGLASFERGPEK